MFSSRYPTGYDKRQLALLLTNEAVSEIFMLEPHALTHATRFTEVSGWDSVSHVMLLMRIEELAGGEIDIEEATSAEDLGSLAAIVQRTLELTQH